MLSPIIGVNAHGTEENDTGAGLAWAGRGGRTKGRAWIRRGAGNISRTAHRGRRPSDVARGMDPGKGCRDPDISDTLKKGRGYLEISEALKGAEGIRRYRRP